MTDSAEIELKFMCAPDQLSAVLAAAPDGQEELRELTSVYFDTPDLTLQKAGATLRVRESKGQRVQTLKRGSGFARQEHEAPIEGAAPDLDVGPLRELLNGEAAELRPAFDVRVTRRQRLIAFDGAQIELAADQGEVRAGGATSPISEVELELKSGEPGALFGLARELSRAAPLYLSFDTKSDRGQALVAGEALEARRKSKLALKPDATAAQVFQAIARQALGQIAANAAVLRAQMQEGAREAAVHQLRVAARTLRSALTTFKAIVADDALPHLKGELRWLAKTCDAARNLDVFVRETLEPAAESDSQPAGLPALREAVDAARTEARRAACEAASSERFRALMIEAVAWVETGAWIAAAPETSGREFGAQALARRRRKLLRRARRLRKLSDEARHEARIEAKKLRYTAEAFAPLWPDRRGHRFIARVKELQEHLGALNDLATAEALVAQLDLSPEAAFTAGELVGLKAGARNAHLKDAAEAVADLKRAEAFWD